MIECEVVYIPNIFGARRLFGLVVNLEVTQMQRCPPLRLPQTEQDHNERARQNPSTTKAHNTKRRTATRVVLIYQQFIGADLVVTGHGTSCEDEIVVNVNQHIKTEPDQFPYSSADYNAKDLSFQRLLD